MTTLVSRYDADIMIERVSRRHFRLGRRCRDCGRATRVISQVQQLHKNYLYRDTKLTLHISLLIADELTAVDSDDDPHLDDSHHLHVAQPRGMVLVTALF